MQINLFLSIFVFKVFKTSVWVTHTVEVKAPANAYAASTAEEGGIVLNHIKQ